MRTTLTWARAGMVAALVACTAATGYANKLEMRGKPTLEVSRDSVLRIPANASFPLTKRLGLGVGNSLAVQFPGPLKDVLVSDPQILDAVVQSSDRVFLIAKKAGQTNAFFFDEHGQQLLTLEVAVGADLSALDNLLRRLISGSNIQSEIAGNALILTGSVRTPIDSSRAAQIAAQFVNANSGSLGTTATQSFSASGGTATFQNQTATPSDQGDDDAYAAKSVINLLSVEGEEQVMIRVTVAEVQRSILKQFGINVGALLNQGNFTTAILSENAFPLTTAAGLGTLPTAGIATTGAAAGLLQLFNQGPGGAGAPFGNSGIASAWQSGNQAVNGAIRAMERDGLLKTLAEPNLTAVSGESAKFLAGGEFPIPVVDTLGQVSVTFKEFGIGVAFTPVVLSGGRISLKIEVEVSELTNDGAVVLSNISIPALKKREAKSTVELPSGGSLALAGLLSQDTRQDIDGFPGLKDVPILGTLFRSRDYQNSETELVIIVTPYMVRPTARRDLARPGDGLSAATDRRANFLGHINRVYGRGGPVPVGDLKGDYGFIVE
jgi:pilus assembly protein CpaC